jgi:hypothetical protein
MMIKVRSIFFIVSLICIAWGANGCAFSSDLLFEPPPVTPPALQGTPKVTSTSAPLPSEPYIPPTTVPCAYAWTNKDLPDESAFVQEALKKAGLGDVEAALSAYGENCLDTTTDTIISFTAMQTDFFFSIPVDDINNRAELGNLAEKILRVVAQFPPGKVPGVNTGYVGLVYSTGREEKRLWFQVAQGMRALESGLIGEAMFDGLSTNP